MAGLTKKIISGLGSGLWSAGKSMVKPNTIADGGGLSSLLVPVKVNKRGGLAAISVVGGASLISNGATGNSKARMGAISYGDGMARMTDSFTTGGVEAMRRVSGGDYEAFSEMAGEALQSPTLAGQIDDFGANPGMIAALYGMGGN